MPPLERATLDEKELARLIDIYTEGQKRIIGTFDNATDFGQARRIEQLAQIDRILNELGVATGDWVDTVLGGHYERGTKDAIDQLTALKVGIKETSTMSTIDRRAVAALASDAQLAFGAALTTVGRSANKILSDAVKEGIKMELAQGRVLGSTLKETTRRIKSQMQTDGLTALIDKGGRQWTLDRYAEMLARTKMVEARNTGLANKMVENGYDLVEVSRHGSKHKACAHYEGMILSLTGKTPGYPTLESAMHNGLLHPNCRHQINAVKTDYAAITTAYDSRSQTYVQPFKLNPPAPTTAQVKVPTGGKAKLMPTPERSIVTSKSVTMSSAGKTASYALTELEGKFVNGIGINIKTSDGKVLMRNKNTRGYYSPSENELVMRHVHDDDSKHTFYHELGHALDFSAYKVADTVNANGALRHTGDMIRSIRADRDAIVATRLAKDLAGQGYKLTKSNAEKLAKGVVADLTEVASGKVMKYQSSRKWLTYARKETEVFADAYGQYRLNPKKFEKYAPAMYQMFKILGL